MTSQDLPLAAGVFTGSGQLDGVVAQGLVSSLSIYPRALRMSPLKASGSRGTKQGPQSFEGNHSVGL